MMRGKRRVVRLRKGEERNGESAPRKGGGPPPPVKKEKGGTNEGSSLVWRGREEEEKHSEHDARKGENWSIPLGQGRGVLPRKRELVRLAEKKICSF